MMTRLFLLTLAFLASSGISQDLREYFFFDAVSVVFCDLSLELEW